MPPNRGWGCPRATPSGEPLPNHSTRDKMAKVSSHWLSSPTFLLSRDLLGHSPSRSYFIRCLLGQLSSCAFCFCLNCSISTISWNYQRKKWSTAKPPSSTPLPPAKPYRSTTTGLPGRGHSRVKGDGNVDTKLLSQPITFPFSGRTALNRVLKSPMTERLCHWSNEDITRCGVPSPKLINLYR
jgi:hypothetical protein